MDNALVNSLLSASRSTVLSEIEKKIIIERVGQALVELTALTTSRFFWAMSPFDGGYVLDREKYSNEFLKSTYVTSTRSLFESSIGRAVVPLKASDLAGMFLDMIYGRMHILSPLVAPREFILLRYCEQQPSNTWYIVDISRDFLGKTKVSHPTFSWRLPSGVVIRNLPDGQSEVTWVEHVLVNGSNVHPLYRHLLSTSHGYRAARWLHTLQRMTERSLYSEITGSTSVNEQEGRKNMKTFTLRMIRDFCSILSNPGNLSKSSNPNPNVRMSVRNNNIPYPPHSMIVAASTSVWLPVTYEDLFNFLRDETMRPKWDVMNDRAAFSNIGSFLTGTTPGNCISAIQSSLMKERKFCLLQESSIDPIGALVIFAPVYLPMLTEIMNGADKSNISLLSNGFLISSDGCLNENGNEGASTSRGTTSRQSCSLLTLAIQWLLQDISESGQNEAADTLEYNLASIIKDIREALGCPQ